MPEIRRERHCRRCGRVTPQRAWVPGWREAFGIEDLPDRGHWRLRPFLALAALVVSPVVALWDRLTPAWRCEGCDVELRRERRRERRERERRG